MEVSPSKASRTPSPKKSLEYGRVSILSNSRFSVLSTEKDDGEEDENKKKEEKGEDDNISHKNLAEENQNEDGEIVEVNVQDAGGKLPLNPGVDWNVEEVNA